MKDFIEGPKIKSSVIQAHLSKAMLDIQHYMAPIVLMDKRICSGTFVSACGFNGILTAYHVATPVLAETQFGLCITAREHALFVNSKNCQHVVVGHAENGNQGEMGPDLSFIIIRDPKLLETIRSLKSFCNLDRKDLEYFKSPIERMQWCISGSPYEASKLVGVVSDGPLMMYQNFVGEATFHSRVQRGDYDFIRLNVTSGHANFPTNCKGMSGGGMWLVPLSVENNNDLSTLRHEAPLLSGVSFYQSEVENGERIITGHGFDSIYFRLRQTLRELK
jgi:hypothetical protein